MPNKNFIFFGGSEFSVKIAEILFQNSFIPKLIITTPDKPRGRKLTLTPPPLKLWAEKNKIKYIQPEKLTHYSLRITDFDFAVIAAYGKILPKEIIDIIPTINVHPSLLPEFRGASPIQSFILSGEKETGVTLMLTDEQVDHGPIIAQRNLETEFPSTFVPLGSPTSKCLEEKLAELGGKLLVEILPKFLSGEVKPIPQDHSRATFTKKITKQDGLVDLEKDSSEIIERKVRAFTPWPSVYYFKNGKRVIITKTELQNGPPTGEASKLKILRVKPEGKNEIDFRDYLKENPNSLLKKYL